MESTGAEWIENSGRPAWPSRIARLWQQAGVKDTAIAYLRDAARQASDAAAHERAARQLGQALDLVGTGSEWQLRCDLLLEHGEALWNSGHFRRSQAAFKEAADVSLDPERLGVAALGFAGRLGFQGVTTDTTLTELLERALEALGDKPTPLRVRLMACQAGALTFSTEKTRQEGIRLARRVVDEAEQLPSEDPDHLEILSDVLCRTCWLTWTPTNLHDRLALADRMVEITTATSQQSRELESRVFRICTAVERGAIDLAREDAQRCRYVADILKLPYYDALVAFVDGMFALLDGPDREWPRRALDVGKRQEHPGVVQLFGAQMLYVHLVEGRTDELLAASRDLTDCYRSFAPWKAGLALIHAEMGDTIAAAAHIDELLGNGIPLDMFWFICMDHAARVVSTLAAAGEDRSEQIGKLYEELLPYADRYVVAGAAVAIHVPVSLLLGLLAGADGTTLPT